jgi:cysteinyl-tRNA synthetase
MFTKIKLFNTYTSQTDEIKEKNLNWYTCGPTVYSEEGCHIGHGRTFMILDALTRTMRKFGYKITSGINITDIDDKILNKVKLKYWISLYDEISKKYDSEFLTKSWQSIGLEKYDEKQLDKWLLTNGKTEDEIIPTYEMYEKFITYTKNKFWQDLDTLNIRKPDLTISVSDIIPEIINLIEDLVKSGFAYVGISDNKNKSVYFNTSKFKETYGECALSNSNENDKNVKHNFTSEKRNPHDFSLWKATKKYEIGFDSPWGIGRISWHIECSAMIKKMFPNNKLDIHAGGIDLKFPHHHNECLQSIAISGNKDWCTTFIHTGHLHVNSEKMAQSLGNFITIRQFLKEVGGENASRVMRLMCLMYKWNSVMNYDDNSIPAAKDLDVKIEGFIKHVNFIIKNNKPSQFYTDKDLSMKDQLDKFKENITNELINDFNTPAVINLIRGMINCAYVYLNDEFNSNIIQDISDEIVSVLNTLGLVFAESTKQVNTDKILDVILEIRDKIREDGKSIPDKQAKMKLFNLSDWIRDVKLKESGYKIEDLKGVTKCVPL